MLYVLRTGLYLFIYLKEIEKKVCVCVCVQCISLTYGHWPQTKRQATTRTVTCAHCSAVAVKGQDANVHTLASNNSHCSLAFPFMQICAGALQLSPTKSSQTKTKLTSADGPVITALACSCWHEQFLTTGFLDWLNLSRLARLPDLI